jgi:hypothetical protein
MNQEFNQFVEGVAGGVLAFAACAIVLGICMWVVLGIRSAVRGYFKTRRKRQWRRQKMQSSA